MTAARVTYVNAPNGVAHTADTVRRMAKLAREGAHTYAIRSLATRITHDVPSKDTRGEFAAIYRWVRDNIRYRFDPLGLEWVQSPERTIQEQAGDCDDIAVLIASLVQAIGHQTRFQTVGPTQKRQSHVYAQAWDRKQWVTVDPVLEPVQPTTAPRADLGLFGHSAPGTTRTYNDKGQPMAGITDRPSAIRLWQPTVFERSRLLTDHPNPAYRSRGSAGRGKMVRVSLWNNPLDPFDLGRLDQEPSDLGFNFLKAIGSVAKVASAVGVPGAGAISAGLDIGSKFLPKGKKPASAPATTAAPTAGAGSSFGPPAGSQAQGFPSAAAFAPVLTAATAASRDAIAALERQNAAAINAITGLARGMQRGQNARAMVKTRARAKAATQPKPAKKRQRWDANAKRWVVYKERSSGTIGAFHPQFHVSLMGADAAQIAAAPALAAQLVDSIKRKGAHYDRRIASAFQTAAGIDIDGKYGGGTAGAVRYFTGKAPPRPIFKPYAEKRYAPPAVTQQVQVQQAPATSSAYAPAPSAPRAPVSAGARSVAVAPRTSAPPIVVSSQRLTRREMAANLVQMVTAQTQATGKPPAGVVTGAVTYQRAAGLKTDGKWGPKTRAAAAADLNVPDSSLPRSAFDKPARRRRQQTARTRPTSSAPTSSAPAVYDPIASSQRDPGLPMFPGDAGPKPIDLKQPSAEPKKDNTPIVLFALWAWTRRRAA